MGRKYQTPLLRIWGKGDYSQRSVSKQKCESAVLSWADLYSPGTFGILLRAVTTGREGAAGI